MKKAIILSLMVLLVLSVTSLAFANAPCPEFKPFNAFFNDQNEFIVQGKYFNWSEYPATVNHEKLRVTIWGSMGMNTYTLDYNLGVELNSNEMQKHTFISKNIPIQTINNWSISTSTDSKLHK